MRFRRAALMIACGIALVSCGGGGGGASSSVNTAEGLWIGTSSTGYSVAIAILENGETWGLYSSGNTIYGALQGNLVGNGSNVTGSGSDFNVAARTVSSASVSGTVAAKSTISLKTSANVNFSGNYRSEYDQPAALSSLAGTYSGWGVSGTSTTQAISITVSSSGAISSGDPSCTVSGSATPRASGKNAFNITVTFAGASCALGNGITTTGIAVLDSSVSPGRLYALALKSDRSDGFLYTGTR